MAILTSPCLRLPVLAAPMLLANCRTTEELDHCSACDQALQAIGSVESVATIVQ
ncbi:hypothetical protein [Povalibacter sp.]|uniref:hypothetical protein n=1 Tax=Povalibacter sp. TaxID=1962978 RepID=UPI002F40CB4E